MMTVDYARGSVQKCMRMRRMRKCWLAVGGSLDNTPFSLAVLHLAGQATRHTHTPQFHFRVSRFSQL